MKAQELRAAFLGFFENKGHIVCPSDTLVPKGDKTLLFTTAGMVQFKPLYAGAPLDFSRAATVQKCLRAGGKDSDLENVGRTIRHHTFFEMLGNFSFGDYFKQEAITWAWEFITDVLDIDTSRLYVSVYKDDDEAVSFWTKNTGIDAGRIMRLGAADNFWGPAGDSGACGPSSEIYYDLGADMGCGNPGCAPGCDCERYLEFWNLVFPQFYQEKDGSRRPLERQGIDTGMGLERLAMIAQGKKNNYHTDLFMPLIEKIQDVAGQKYGGDRDRHFHVVADHARTVTFAFCEHIMPSNEGRGYVLRRILRRAVRHGLRLDMQEPFLYKLAGTVADIMGAQYPELVDNRTHAEHVIRSEEERFLSTLTSNMPRLEEAVRDAKSAGQTVLSPETVFMLYDTYGLSPDIIEEVSTEEGIAVDREGFKQLMDRQRQSGKASWKGGDSDKEAYDLLHSKGFSTVFVGYDTLEADTEIFAIVKDGKQLSSLNQGETGGIIISASPLYAEAGGQVGDKGRVTAEDGAVFEVSDTTCPRGSFYVLHGHVVSGTIKAGSAVTARTEALMRTETERHHTATHLLHNALRSVLGVHVKQAGSFVAFDRLRLDFSHHSALTQDEIKQVEDMVNGFIREDNPVKTSLKALADAQAAGAIALFGEKYGDTVRVVDIGGRSIELCGGTHVERTSVLGCFKIIAETSISAGIRRIEAVCSRAAFSLLDKSYRTARECAKILSCEVDVLPERTLLLVERVKELEKKAAKHAANRAVADAQGFFDKARQVGNVRVVCGILQEAGNDALRQAADQIASRGTDITAVFFAVPAADKVLIVVKAGQEAVKAGIHAGRLACSIAALVGGKGGGRPDMAQAGGKEPENIEQAMRQIDSFIAGMQK